MPIEVSWYLQGRVIYKHYHGVVTLEHIQQTNEQVIDYVTTAKAQVHIIVDSQDVTRHPYSLKDLNTTLPRSKAFYNSLGWTVLISNHYIHRFMGQMSAQLTRARFQTVSTLDEALQFLNSIDDTLCIQSPTHTS